MRLLTIFFYLISFSFSIGQKVDPQNLLLQQRGLRETTSSSIQREIDRAKSADVIILAFIKKYPPVTSLQLAFKFSESKQICAQRISSIDLEEAHAIADMRNGAFCRACHRTRTQVEADHGESWQEHLKRNSNGTAVAATPQEIAEKEREYEDKKATVARDLDEARRAEQNVNEATQEIMRLWTVWNNAAWNERGYFVQAWERDRGNSEGHIYRLRIQKDRLGSLVSKYPTISKAYKAAKASADESQRLFTQAQTELSSLYLDRQNQAKELEGDFTSNAKLLSDACTGIGPFGTWDGWMLSNLAVHPYVSISGIDPNGYPNSGQQTGW